MKIFTAFLLLGAATSSIAQCDTSISDSTDTPRTIRKKISCLVEENQRLKEEHARLKQENARLTESKPVQTTGVPAEKRMGFRYTQYDPKIFPREVCVNKAYTVLSERGAISLNRADEAVRGTIDGNSVMIICEYGGYGFVVLDGPFSNQKLTQKLIDEMDLLSMAIFPH